MVTSDKDLSRVSYIGTYLNDHEEEGLSKLIKVGHETSKGINFHEKIIITHLYPECETYDFKIIKIDTVDYSRYTEWVFSKEGFGGVPFSSDFMINFHTDGMIQNPDAWTDDFLNYDYIGAPWALGHPVKFDNKEAFWGGGNGGFTLRSKKLCEMLSEIDTSSNTPIKNIDDHEDILICHTHFKFLREKGIKFAPTDVSAKFSTEHFSPSSQGFAESFGFHEIEKLFNTSVKEHRRQFLENILKD